MDKKTTRIASVRLSSVCFPVCTHHTTIIFADGKTSTRTMSGREIAHLLTTNGLHTRDTPHPQWEHLKPFADQRDIDSTMRSCSYNKEKPTRYQVTKLKATEQRENKELLLQMRDSGDITEEDMKRQMIDMQIMTEDGKYINWTVAPRNKTASFTNQFRAMPLNKANKKRKKGHKRREGAYRLTLENAVCKLAIPGGPPLAYLPVFCKCILSRFPASSTSCKFPLCVCSSYETGQVGVAGASDDVTGLLATHMFARVHAVTMRKYVPVREFGCVNFTTSGSIGMEIDLWKLARAYDKYPDREATYDPTVIDMVQIKAVPKEGETTKGKPALLVSASGRLCAVGFLSRADISKFEDEVDRVRAVALECLRERQELAAEREQKTKPAVTSMAAAIAAAAEAAASTFGPVDDSESENEDEAEGEDGDEDPADETPDGDLNPADLRPAKRVRV